MNERLRTVARVVQAQTTLEGGGFTVQRPFPTPVLDQVDPFLLLDRMGPVDYAPGAARGAPDHPHRGFETVTYLLAGEMEHRDSAGHAGFLEPGDVQWMTAGAGVVHSEMPSARMLQEGGRLHGFQLWVNLPRRDKMTAPRYQEIKAAAVPVGRSEDGLVTVRVIAGESLGKRADIDTRTPILYLHFSLAPGARHVQPVPRGFSAFAFVFDGSARFDSSSAGEWVDEGRAAIFNADGDAVGVEGGGQGAEFLLVAGEPLREPVARFGPFVMNYKAELLEALRDFESGKMGRIAAEVRKVSANGTSEQESYS